MEMATYVLLVCLLTLASVRVERGGDEIDVRIEGSDEFDLNFSFGSRYHLGQRDNLMSVRFLPGFQPASDPATGSGPSQS
jgi:hypothetical protein